MDLIKEISIKYFRSIYSIKLKDVNDCIIFSGKNDVGKSNILKALNLFFNNQTDWQTSFRFYNDFNLKRLFEVREESIKGKQFIQIEIKFRRGKGFRNTLPAEFTVKRTWDRNSNLPKETDDLSKKMAEGKINNSNIKIIKRSLTQYLNKVKFEYVPAIKDQRLFSHLLNELQDEIFSQLTRKGEQVTGEISKISNKYSETINELKNEFKNSTGIHSELALPLEANELFKVLNVVTDIDSSNGAILNLDFRGDGIRLRYIPSLYNFLAENHNGNYILGFEEPENSMEYGLGAKMAKKFFDEYSKNSQIFITSHSPSFLKSSNPQVSFFRVFQSNGATEAIQLRLIDGLFSLDKNEELDNVKLIEELGLTELQMEFHNIYEEKLKESEVHINKIEELNLIIKNYEKPVVFTEGKTDVWILKTAWEKLFPNIEILFEILPVETTDEGGGDGGYVSLNRKIESVKNDEKVQIGLYDRDDAGFKKGFEKLNRNMIPCQNKEYVKSHKNGRSHAIVLPEQNGLENFVKHINLPIEFMFSEDDLNKKNSEGKGLKLLPYQREVKFNNEVVETVVKNEVYLCTIDSNTKKIFAQEIVPSLQKDSFINFLLLFNTIREIIEISDYNKV